MGLGTNCLLMLTPARAGLAYLGPAKLQTGCSPSLARLSVGCWGHKSLDSLWCCEAQSQRLRGLKEKTGEGGTEEGRGIKSDSLLFTEKEGNNVSSWVRVTSVPHSKKKKGKKKNQQWIHIAKAHNSFLPRFLSPFGCINDQEYLKAFCLQFSINRKDQLSHSALGLHITACAISTPKI